MTVSISPSNLQCVAITSYYSQSNLDLDSSLPVYSAKENIDFNLKFPLLHGIVDPRQGPWRIARVSTILQLLSLYH